MSHQLARDNAIFPIKAAAALSKGQAVKLDGNYQIVAATGSDTPHGYLTEDVASGDYGSVYVGTGEIAYVQAHDNAIVPGTLLIPAAAGRLDGGTTGNIVAKALEASTAQGHLIQAVILTPVTKA